MLHRFVPGILAALALVCFVSQATLADDKDKTHTGVVVKAGDGKLTMSSKDGKDQHTHKVAATATITCDGKACKLSDLKEGCTVTVTYKDDTDKTASKIEAKTKAK